MSLDDALSRADAGDDLSRDDLVAVLSARGPELDAVLEVAGALRDRGLREAGRPGVFTYSRKVFVPITTLCRDRCHYCVFVDTPGQLQRAGKPVFMSPEQVLAVARAGQRQGCKEALLTLGDRPEERWPEARRWLDEHGFASTLDYVAYVANLITTETGMLAHLNPGVMSADELQRLRPFGPSMGMMLETTSRDLFETPGQVHYGSPDKDPDLRLRVIEDAGIHRIPFTTGILVGIGETITDRAESLLALRDAQRRYGHLQEIIVQNFRAKPGTAMRDAADADLEEYTAAVAAARLAMGANARIQVPPNLSDPTEFALLVRAGADDWGGVSPVTADHVNPERPWPHLDDLAARTAELGFELRERLTAHPEYVHAAATWIAPELHAAVAALADPVSGLAAPTLATPSTASAARRSRASSVAALATDAATDPASLADEDWARLLTATGADLDALTSAADDVRRYTVGEAISVVVNRNLTTTGLRASVRVEGPDRDTFTLTEVAEIARDAADLGASELCVQGVIPTDADAYLGLARAVKDAAPTLHLHAFRPQDAWDFATRSGLSIDEAYRALRDAGVDTVPGTGVKVLDDGIRERVAPTDIPIADWLAAIRAAHAAGLRSTSVLFYGHVESAADRISHLRTLRSLQLETGGFTEFVPIPLPGFGVPLVEGRSPIDEHRAMVAVSRLLLSGAIAHIQVPWPRLDAATIPVLLRSGADDLGGTLLDGRILPRAGVEHGRELPLPEAERIARHLLRPLRQRTTDYRDARPTPPRAHDAAGNRTREMR
ncbi:7,8-didemethyl-8-hydroxy-5-deazariboflavin synthase CofG [Microbacterium schleiferi]|uniref:7,8-didemethyl-8-hydroxy-5-deazariboflavin synthase n=1 Tax=Microbacterium schleiferi TaxID=69362 RepID=A0A7S8MZP3_9MICO|nr:7,8-didemethyl-8-hydroxy-5-deazariboflavin synthase CofG [Microbacterium schleiferi]